MFMKNISAIAIALMLVTLPSKSLFGLHFSRHNADSPNLNAIAATGDIEKGDTEQLRQYLRKLPRKSNTAIYLGSRGGSLLEGLRLGYLFKEMRIKTVVEGDPPNNMCASACALAFLGGHDAQGHPWRSSTTNSVLGYHQFYCGNGMRCEGEQTTVSVILQYGKQMSVPQDIFIQMFGQRPEGMRWFNVSELCSLGIKVWDMSNKRFLCN